MHHIRLGIRIQVRIYTVELIPRLTALIERRELIIEAFLIVIIGGLGNVWGALLGALIFGLTQSLGILIWPQFGIVFPYMAVVIVLVFRPTGLLKSTW